MRKFLLASVVFLLGVLGARLSAQTPVINPVRVEFVGSRDPSCAGPADLSPVARFPPMALADLFLALTAGQADKEA